MKFDAGFENWCGLAGRDGSVRAAAELAIDGSEEALQRPCWRGELDTTLRSLETCRALGCSAHRDADDARRLLDRIIYAAECADAR